jgi:hypothetical protein
MSEPVKIVYYPDPGKVYTREDLMEVFSRYGSSDPLVAALRQICQARFAQAAVDSADASLTERQAGHAAGRIQEITDLRDELLGYLNTTAEGRNGEGNGNAEGAEGRRGRRGRNS